MSDSHKLTQTLYFPKSESTNNIMLHTIEQIKSSMYTVVSVLAGTQCNSSHEGKNLSGRSMVEVEKNEVQKVNIEVLSNLAQKSGRARSSFFKKSGQKNKKMTKNSKKMLKREKTEKNDKKRKKSKKIIKKEKKKKKIKKDKIPRKNKKKKTLKKEKTVSASVRLIGWILVWSLRPEILDNWKVEREVLHNWERKTKINDLVGTVERNVLETGNMNMFMNDNLENCFLLAGRRECVKKHFFENIK